MAIPTFSNKASMKDVREKSLNPTITEVNLLDDEMTEAQAAIMALTTNVGTLTTANETLTTNVETLTTNLAATNQSAYEANAKVDLMIPVVASAEAKIEALENKPNTFVALTDTPAALTANKILVTNAGGTGVIESSVPLSDLTSISTTRAGMTSGSTYASTNCIGENTFYATGNVTAEQSRDYSVILVNPSDATKSITLGDIVNHDSTTLDSLSVREGRVTIISNQGTASYSIKAKRGGLTATQKIVARNVEYDSIPCPGGFTITLYPTKYNTGVNRWIVLSKVSNGL